VEEKSEEEKKMDLVIGSHLDEGYNCCLVPYYEDVISVGRSSEMLKYGSYDVINL